MNPPSTDAARILDSLAPLPPPVARPALAVLCGLPGSGKSTVAHALQERTAAALVQSDRVRKLLIPQPAYTSGESARVFRAIHAVLTTLLTARIPAILDATMLTNDVRRPVVALAANAEARVIFVVVEAPEAVIRARLTARHTGRRAAYDVSDADIAVYETMRSRWQPVRGPHIHVDTSHDMLPAIEEIAALMAGDQV